MGRPDETDIPECADGLDNDDDGNTDYPDDLQCSSFVDNTEEGPTGCLDCPACADGIDNDDDGKTDFDGAGTPADADPGCIDALDTSEADVPQCANGADDDLDGKTDYPSDPGCTSPTDDDETGGGFSFPDAGVVDGGSQDAGGSTTADARGPMDPGGVMAPGGGGCCRIAGPGSDPPGLPGTMWLVLAVWLRVQRRQKTRGLD